MKARFVLLIFILAALAGCRENDKEGPVVLDLSRRLSTGFFKSNELPSFEVVSEVELDPDVPMGLPFICYCSDDLICITDDKRIFFFNRDDGKLFSDLTHVGRGPAEYLYPTNISVRDTVVCISDRPETGKAVFYSIKGQYLRTQEIPVNSSYVFLDEDYYALLYNNHEETCFEVFLNDGTPVRSSMIDCGPKNSANTFITQILKMNDGYTMKPALRDTLYTVTPLIDTPWVVLDKGEFTMPDEFLFPYASWADNRVRYITLESCRIAGNNAFVEFQYGGEEYHEIWDIKQQKLLFKSCLRDDDIFSSRPVMEISVGSVPFWPSYVFHSDLLCIWGEENPRVVQVRPSPFTGGLSLR